ncbi:hypothetical protein [Acidipropionibacterium jensenii]|uniref:hypothetical protein n=2 Tax=Acidipropionibacterium jensenii TaxID=1749 RepID=UPI0026471387|nr:hypothetical protein [Acidipropionibacterium jensenii]MDN5963709.1 hypothetical protein [Actinomyces sp.]MDN6618084.1 hypothetical protein [Corynebacterium variabile]MDN6442153.1 hypothetical protein [Acidipropionibacterium jensenii]MDN6565847.1 hypothetical protein [Actinomyces sp.]MDN6593068.1 hypothetical protein [Acidipropionibacterium jensenii]
MIIHTRSATPLERVMIEPSSGGKAHVWLRRNITESTEDFEGQPVQVWDADEVYYLADETPTIGEVEAQFATLWAEHEIDDLTPLERAQQRVAQLETALVELADLLGGE